MTAIMVVYSRRIVTENMKFGFTEGLGCRSLLLVIVIRAATVKTMKSAVDTKELAAQAKTPLRSFAARRRLHGYPIDDQPRKVRGYNYLPNQIKMRCYMKRCRLANSVTNPS